MPRSCSPGCVRAARQDECKHLGNRVARQSFVQCGGINERNACICSTFCATGRLIDERSAALTSGGRLEVGAKCSCHSFAQKMGDSSRHVWSFVFVTVRCSVVASLDEK